MSIALTVETFSANIRESEPMWHAHWQETEEYRHETEFSVDVQERLLAEKAGRYIYIAARNEAGELVGHCTAFIRLRGTYGKHSQAFEDVLYLKPEYRKGRNGMRLLAAMEDEAQRRGCREVRVSGPESLGRFWLAAKYQSATTTWVKILKGVDDVR